jgi:hypothetical protein
MAFDMFDFACLIMYSFYWKSKLFLKYINKGGEKCAHSWQQCPLSFLEIKIGKNLQEKQR